MATKKLSGKHKFDLLRVGLFLNTEKNLAAEKKRIGHIFITMWRKWRRWRFVCVISIVFVRLVSPQTVHLNKREVLNALNPIKASTYRACLRGVGEGLILKEE